MQCCQGGGGWCCECNDGTVSREEEEQQQVWRNIQGSKYIIEGYYWQTLECAAICGQRQYVDNGPSEFFLKNALLLLNELSHIHLCNNVVVVAVAVVAVVVNNNAANFKFCAHIYFYAPTRPLLLFRFSLTLFTLLFLGCDVARSAVLDV